MTRTASWTVDSLPPNTAKGYTRGAQDAPPSTPLGPNTALLPGRGSSAGGGYAPPHDLPRLLHALRARTIPSGPPPVGGVGGGAAGTNAAGEGYLRSRLQVMLPRTSY